MKKILSSALFLTTILSTAGIAQAEPATITIRELAQ